jgi:tetratricopeptide (TPR) repeat protein
MLESSGGGRPALGASDDAIQRAMASLRANCADEAERIVRAVLAVNANDPDALHVFGISLLARQRWAEAIGPLQQAADVRCDPIMETHCALAFRQSGRLPEALTWLERAASHEPVYPQALLELGIVLCAMQRYDEAEAALQRGLRHAPDAVELSVELGGVYICRAEAGKAKAAFARALALAPRHPRALHGSGIALLYQGEIAAAADHFRQVIAIEPGHVRAQLDLAHSLLELGRRDEAIAGLRTLVAAVPGIYGQALHVLVSSGRSRFWLRPSDAAAALRPPSAIGPQGAIH